MMRDVKLEDEAIEEIPERLWAYSRVSLGDWVVYTRPVSPAPMKWAEAVFVRMERGALEAALEELQASDRVPEAHDAG